MAGNNVSTRSEKGQYVQKYDWDAIIPELLEHIRDGKIIAAFCEQDGMPTEGAVIAQVRYVNPDKWEKAYEAAMQTRADRYGFDLDKLYEDVKDGKIDPQAGRTAAYIAIARMGQMAPRRYNDKVIHQTINHTVDVSIRDRMTRREEIEPPTIDGHVETIDG